MPPLGGFCEQFFGYHLAVDENSSASALDFSDNGEGVNQLTYGDGVNRFDFNADTFVNAADIDLLGEQKELGTALPQWDMDGDSYRNNGVAPTPDGTASDQDDYNYLIEQIFQTGLGDADLDNDVDVNDLNLWKASRFTAPTGWANGDFDGDGSTDVSDLNLWKANRYKSFPAVIDLLA